MSDSEHDVETFESADAGASHTIPMQAGSVRKNGFIVRASERSTRTRRRATAGVRGAGWEIDRRPWARARGRGATLRRWM